MNKLNLLLLLWLSSATLSHAQTLGEAVTKYFGKSQQQIIGLYGADYHQDVDNSGKTLLGYERIFSQAGKSVTGKCIFHFKNDRVIQNTTVIGQDYYHFWQNEFKKKLIQRDSQYWIEPRYNLVWNLKIYDNQLYITAIDNNALRVMSPNVFGHNWTKEVEAEFMKNCVYGNPNNVGKEATFQPICSCAYGKLKQFFPDANYLFRLTGEDLTKLLKSCM